MRSLLIILLTCFLFFGCSSKPVRHLASDAALIQPEVSTLDDVIRFLGQPNGRRTIGAGEVEFVYYEDQPAMFSNAPVVGDWLDKDGYEMIVVTLRDNIVTSCEFRTYKASDRDWADDFTWEDFQ